MNNRFGFIVRSNAAGGGKSLMATMDIGQLKKAMALKPTKHTKGTKKKGAKTELPANGAKK